MPLRLPSSPFHASSADGGSSKRFRQHINPLASQFQVPKVTDLRKLVQPYADPKLPFHVDVGCAKGTFLLEMAARHPERNFLGLEIRPLVAEFALERKAKRPHLTNLHFVACNANVDIDQVVLAILEAESRVAAVSILFPDPHFKKQHKKRRVVTPELVSSLAAGIRAREGGPVGDETVYLASDIQDVLDEMREVFAADANFRDDEEEGSYLEKNPYPVATEREGSVLDQDLPVWRSLFRLKGAEEMGGGGGATTSIEDLRAAAELKQKMRESEQGRFLKEKGAGGGGGVDGVIIEEGANKYVLVSARDPASQNMQIFVRSSAAAAYHREVAEPLVAELIEGGRVNVKVLGGGRINVDTAEKKVVVYGFSYAFGKADHRKAAAMIRRAEGFEDFDVTWNDEGY
ncbi:hypothetical protein TeGR_g4231 [Tetraparma gracilis]|uniref:tRNA (guanine(46)-N(7))-methyltransferase n=1 Tax=Tetraparma gracilis TaxID=2962635 RepID=A0ABQ6NAP9_9STRA|nr:hypothetical protein TeGR_g4231 [Tetraparma gracilis]